MRLFSLNWPIGSWLRLPGRRRAMAGAVAASAGARSRRKVLALAALLMLAVGGAGHAADSAARVDVQRDGETYFVRASAVVAADLAVAWGTLIDYERLPEFVPDIRQARVLARDGNRSIVELHGGLRLLFFEWPVRMRLAVRHEPYERVVAQSDPGLIDGRPATLRDFSGRYTLAVVPLAGRAGVRLDYDARFELTEEIPTLIGVLFGRQLVRAALRGQFDALLDEIERRQAARPSIQRSTS